jgi:hypothetical protein
MLSTLKCLFTAFKCFKSGILSVSFNKNLSFFWFTLNILFWLFIKFLKFLMAVDKSEILSVISELVILLLNFISLWEILWVLFCLISVGCFTLLFDHISLMFQIFFFNLNKTVLQVVVLSNKCLIFILFAMVTLIKSRKTRFLPNFLFDLCWLLMDSWESVSCLIFLKVCFCSVLDVRIVARVVFENMETVSDFFILGRISWFWDRALLSYGVKAIL